MSFRPHFSRFLEAAPERLHFAAHSHHLWPNVTEDAHRRAWEEAALFADRKWDGIFGELLPRVRARIARVLSLPGDGASLALAPNTHEFITRIFSCFDRDRPVRVLTTDAEFHSFRRQLLRWQESGRVEAEIIPAEPFDDFPARLCSAAQHGGHDVVFLSHVHFNSAYVHDDLAAVVRSVPDPETFIVIDGYHGFCAIPTDLSSLADRVFYLSGGYKYAMSGEGACFLHCPPGYGARPENTGWFAGFSELEGAGAERVGYDQDGSRFQGATFDPSGYYRLDATLGWLEDTGITIADIHAHVGGLQNTLLERLTEEPAGPLSLANLLPSREALDRGHFLTFRTEEAGEWYERLLARGVVTDFRKDRLRFGFGLYHEPADVDRLHAVLGELAAT